MVAPGKTDGNHPAEFSSNTWRAVSKQRAVLLKPLTRHRYVTGESSALKEAHLKTLLIEVLHHVEDEVFGPLEVLGLNAS